MSGDVGAETMMLLHCQKSPGPSEGRRRGEEARGGGEGREGQHLADNVTTRKIPFLLSSPLSSLSSVLPCPFRG